MAVAKELTKEKNKHSPTKGMMTVDQIVNSALTDISAGDERYEQFLHWAIEGYRDFIMDVSQEVKTVELSLTDWKAIEYPDDYIDWALIGIRCGEMVKVLTNDNNLALTHTLDPTDDNNPTANTALCSIDDVDTDPTRLYYFYFQPTSTYYWANTLNNKGQDQGKLWGLGVKDNGLGYYSDNKERREIQLSVRLNADTKIYLQYVADGYDPCNQTSVNLYAAKLLKYYIHMERVNFSKASKSDKKVESDRYWDEHARVVQRIAPLTIDDVLEAARAGYIQTPYI